MPVAVAAAEAAYDAATNPETRTRGSIADKNAAFNAAETLCGRFAMEIKYNNVISDGLKLNVGVTPPNPQRTPRPAPSTQPVISVVGATEGSQTLTFRDSVTGRNKPPGVTNIQVYRVIAPEAVQDRAGAELYSAFSRNPIGVEFSEADDGKVATYFARWADAKGQVGPWSLPTSMRIAA